MSPSRFHSSTERVAALAWALAPLLGVATACSDDASCGPAGAPPNGLAVEGAGITLRYTDLTSLVGNDCPAVNPPAGVVSVSIEGTQEDGTGRITICIPRPDLVTMPDRTIGGSLSMADVRVFDVMGSANGCTFTLNSAMPPTGTATGEGVCANGDSPAGFALELDAMVTLRRTCGMTTDMVTVPLTGRTAVARRT